MIPLTRYGAREMLVATAVCGVLAVAGWLTFAPAAAAPIAAWLYVLAFFRDPPRRPEAADALLSPADGRVCDITPVGPGEPLEADGVRIGIFMSVFDVHVNRSPAAVTVEGVTHRDGGFLDARNPEAADRNESATVLLSFEHGGRVHRLVVRQVAGLIARRIVTDVRPGERLEAGQRFGMIKFGSRVELWVPDELIGELAVEVGQRVAAGRTALVRLAQPAAQPQETQ
jgi:phosphatidylserine decarboxylase